MARSCLAFILLLLGWKAALADGYSDFNLGIAAANRRDRDQAITSLTAALKAADLPQHLRVTALVARGTVYFQMKSYANALADYSQAIALKPDRIDTYLDRCAVYDEQHQYDKALSDCSVAIRLQPNNWLVRRSRLAIYFETKDIDNAIAEYTAGLADRPKDAELLVERSNMYLLEGAFDKALTDLEIAREEYPKWSSPDEAAGRVYFAQGDFDKAMKFDDDAIDKASDDDATPFLSKGQDLWAMGNFADAARAIRRSVDRGGLQNYAFLWLDIVQSKLHAKVPDDIAAQFAAGDMGSFSGSLVLLYLGKSQPDALLKLDGQDPDSIEDIQCTVSFFVGEWYLGEGDPAKARTLLDKASKLCLPRDGTAQMAAIELARLPGSAP